MIKTTTLGLSAASLFLGSACGGASTPAPAAPQAGSSADMKGDAMGQGGDMSGGVKCFGVNECAGKGSCGAPDGSHACAGQNTCKGKGWIMLPAPDCDAQGGTAM